jgi:rare lipoprotein A
MKRWLILAWLGCACAAALAQQGPAVSEFADAAADGDAAAASVAAATAASAVTSAIASAGASAMQARGRLETGIASWYGKRFHGRKTASGEAFDMDALTAAHPRLPFGSWVRVKSLVNGRSVDVRINDRGPHVARRIIDLSRAAAQSLGLASQGTREVEISVLPQRAAVSPWPLR